MITVATSFPLPRETTPEQFSARMADSVPRYRRIDGLRTKSYVFDPVAKTGGGIYTFETRSHADACFSEGLRARAAELFGSFQVTYFETPIVIDNLARPPI